jgi:predicted O-methyltransferase YrrM
MDLSTAIYRVKSWLKFQLTAWNTGGEGIHSPYLFEWVRMVMSDAHAYNIWNEIEQVRARMLASEEVVEFVDYGSAKKLRSLENGSEAAYSLDSRDTRRVKDIAKGSLAKAKYAQMLFRLVNWLGHQLREDNEGLTIVELGTSLGVTTAYLAGVDARDKVYTYEGCEAVARIAKGNWKVLNINNIECRVGEITPDSLQIAVDGSRRIDVAFIDANHTYKGTREYFDVLADKVHSKSVIVVDDIHHSAEMERAWKDICADARVTSTMDLYQMGLVFFDPHYWHRNYTMRL